VGRQLLKLMRVTSPCRRRIRGRPCTAATFLTSLPCRPPVLLSSPCCRKTKTCPRIAATNASDCHVAHLRCRVVLAAAEDVGTRALSEPNFMHVHVRAKRDQAHLAGRAGGKKARCVHSQLSGI